MSATKSEDIRLQMNNVKHKKGDGTLYLMAERLAWMPNAKDNFTISHKYSDIKMQKISPEGKPKIQLQIVLHTSDSTTFQFNNLEDRTAVKDALLQILPLFKGKMPKDRERKAVLLSKNPHLLQLYKDLVETKIISVDDFWSQLVDDQSEQTSESQMEQQDVGVSANFLSCIPLNGKQMKGTVNVETLYAILKTYPKVAKRHQELVPTKMTETDFWNKFFQSRYFSRDRTKDMFLDCAKSDEKEWTSSVRQGNIDPFLDVDMFDDNAYQFNSSDSPASSSNQDQLLIKRFNQSSIRLLDSLKSKETATSSPGSAPVASMSSQSQSQQSTSSSSSTTAAATAAAAAVASATGAPADSVQVGKSDNLVAQLNGVGQGQLVTNPPADEPPRQASFRANRRDWTFDDLAGHENNGDFLDEQSRVGFRMHDVDREMYSIVPQSQQQTTMSSNQVEDHFRSLKSWDPQLTDCLAPKDATEALKHLSPSGYLMRSTNTNRLAETVPEEVQTKLKSAYYAGNELLRHFWLCFPTIDPSLETKLVKLHDTITKFETSKLQPFQDSLPRDQRHLLNHLMRRQIKEAHIKFENWKNKKREKETLSSRTRAATNKSS